jgi:hypothetical protein
MRRSPMELDAVAIELNLVDAAFAGRHSVDLRCEQMNPAKGALPPIAGGFSRWNATGQTRRIGSGSWMSWYRPS